MFGGVIGFLGPIEAQPAETFGHFFIVGVHHTAVAVCTEDLCGVEGGGGDVAHAPGLPAFVFGTMRLGTVLNYVELVFLGDVEQRIHIDTLAIEVDG